MSPGSLPATGEPTFLIDEDKIGLGMGIHGEPGVAEIPMATADELTRAVTVLSDEWAFINNGDLVLEALIPALSERAFVSIYDRDGLLAQVAAADVQAIAADLFDPTASIEVRRS